MHTLDIIRHIEADGSTIIRSHVLHPHNDITVICMVSAEKENVVSVLEDHLLESISATGWNRGEEETDFAFVTEKYNHFQHNLAEGDRLGTSALFGVMVGDELMVSTIGTMSAVLREKNGDLSIIADDSEDVQEFTAVSSGKIPHGAQVFLSSKSLSTFLSDDFFEECAHLSHESFHKTIEGVLERETNETVHVIRIVGETVPEIKPSRLIATSKMSKQLDIARGFMTDISLYLKTNTVIERNFEKLKLFIGTRNTAILVVFLMSGAILFCGLIYVLLTSLFAVTENPRIDIKNQIIEARTLIEESQKLTSNSTAFNTNIKKAEDILFKIRDKQEYMKDTQELLQRIEAMKKEMYDIQTVDLKKYQSIIQFNPSDISPISVYESNKKLNLIGKNNALLAYARGTPLPAFTSYPPGEEVVHSDMTDDGNIFFLTKNDRVLSTKRTEITYVNVTGQESWESADGIYTYFNNIYLLDKEKGQIYKHKTGQNGFSQKQEVLGTPITGIVDIGIDGGFYILTDEPKVYRMISKDGFSQSGILLNKVPGEYTVGLSGKTQVVVRPNLNYIYILSGNRIWIFEPDSKKFQDIRSWTYIAQLELSTDQEIRSISVPHDGDIYLVTNLGVYDISFELIDKNIVLKN